MYILNMYILPLIKKIMNKIVIVQNINISIFLILFTKSCFKYRMCGLYSVIIKTYTQILQ